MASSTVMYPAPVLSTSGAKLEAVGDDMTTGVVLPLLIDGEFDVLDIGDDP